MQLGVNMPLLLPLYFSLLVQVLPGFSSSQETEVICLPMLEQQLPWLSFSNLLAVVRNRC